MKVRSTYSYRWMKISLGYNPISTRESLEHVTRHVTFATWKRWNRYKFNTQVGVPIYRVWTCSRVRYRIFESSPPIGPSKPVLINVQLPELLICSCFDTNTPTVFPTVPLVLQQINYSNFFPLHFTLEFLNLQGCYGVDVKRALKRIIWVRPSGFRISAENHWKPAICGSTSHPVNI